MAPGFPKVRLSKVCLSKVCLPILCALFFSAFVHAQVAPSAELTFPLDFPTSQPEHYSIRIPSDGPARYQSSGRISADSDVTDSFDLDFILGTETRQKIFRL